MDRGSGGPVARFIAALAAVVQSRAVILHASSNRVSHCLHQDVFEIATPQTLTGECPAGTVNVYRLWNKRPDSNHRYTTDLSIKQQMIAKGYVQEGYGPGAVIMCAVNP